MYEGRKTMIRIKTKEQVVAEKAVMDKARATAIALIELCLTEGIEADADAEVKHPNEFATAKEAATAAGREFSFEQALAYWKARKQHETETKEKTFGRKENA